MNGRRWQKGEKIAEVLFQFGSVCICSFMCEHLISKCHTDFQLTKRSKGNTAALEGAQLDLLTNCNFAGLIFCSSCLYVDNSLKEDTNPKLFSVWVKNVSYSGKSICQMNGM